MPPATAGRDARRYRSMAVPECARSKPLPARICPVNFELLARGPPAVSNQPTKTKPGCACCGGPHLDIVPGARVVQLAAAKVPYEPQEHSTCKTFFECCGLGQAALRYQSDLCLRDGVKMRPGCDALVAATTPVSVLNPGCVERVTVGLPFCDCVKM